MRIIDCAQGSPEWFDARAGIPTASEFGNLVSPTYEVRKGDMPASYLARKLAERWVGGPIQDFGGTGDMQQGTLRQADALAWFRFETNRQVHEVGFVLADDGKSGCSPDGLLDGDTSGIEVKSPRLDTHCKYLLAGRMPPEYNAQVQGSMYVTGAAEWTFLSYSPIMPPLLLRVDRDPDAQEAIATALAAFSDRIEGAYQRLVELYGGPPEQLPAGNMPPVLCDIDAALEDYR